MLGERGAQEAPLPLALGAQAELGVPGAQAELEVPEAQEAREDPPLE